MAPHGALTPRRQKFVAEYLANGKNATAAYRAAFGPHRCNVHTLCGRALRILRLPVVVEQIRRADERAQAEIERAISAYALSQGRLALELCHMAFANMKDYIEVDSETGLGRVDLSGLTSAQAAAIKEFSCDVIGPQMGEGPDGKRQRGPPILRVKIKLVDKIAAAEKLARLMGYILSDAPPSSPSDNRPNIIFNFVGSPDAEEQPRVVENAVIEHVSGP